MADVTFCDKLLIQVFNEIYDAGAMKGETSGYSSVELVVKISGILQQERIENKELQSRFVIDHIRILEE